MADDRETPRLRAASAFLGIGGAPRSGVAMVRRDRGLSQQRAGNTLPRRPQSEQLARELGAYLSELPYAPSPASQFLHAMWQASEGPGILRKALSTLQEIRQSACGQRQPAHTAQVRRLVVDECEALQGFPRGYTMVEHCGKPAADGPRYRALGNAFAVPTVRWIAKRLARAN